MLFLELRKIWVITEFKKVSQYILAENAACPSSIICEIFSRHMDQTFSASELGILWTCTYSSSFWRPNLGRMAQ